MNRLHQILLSLLLVLGGSAIFVFGNPYDQLIGRTAAASVISVVFGVSHINATYEFPGGGFVFGIVVFLLGVVGGYAMYRANNLVGSVLFHAGYDLVIITSLLAASNKAHP